MDTALPLSVQVLAGQGYLKSVDSGHGAALFLRGNNFACNTRTQENAFVHNKDRDDRKCRIPWRMWEPFHHSMRGTGLPPPDLHSKVTVVPSLNGPMRETFLMAADVRPSSRRISTYSGAAAIGEKCTISLGVRNKRRHYFQAGGARCAWKRAAVGKSVDEVNLAGCSRDSRKPTRKK